MKKTARLHCKFDRQCCDYALEETIPIIVWSVPKRVLLKGRVCVRRGLLRIIYSQLLNRIPISAICRLSCINKNVLFWFLLIDPIRLSRKASPNFLFVFRVILILHYSFSWSSGLIMCSSSTAITVLSNRVSHSHREIRACWRFVRLM